MVAVSLSLSPPVSRPLINTLEVVSPKFFCERERLHWSTRGVGDSPCESVRVLVVVLHGDFIVALFSWLQANVIMDNLGHRENGRQRPDQYKAVHTQWMMPQRQLKDHHSMNLLALMNERDSAIRERDHALAEKKAAIAERDMAFAQRDAAMAERNAAVVERDNALAALELARTNGLNVNNGNEFPQGSLSGAKNIHHHDQLSHVQSSPLQLADSPYDHVREMHILEAYPVSTAPGNIGKAKRPKKNNGQASPLKRPSGVLRKTKKATGDWKNVGMSGGGEDSGRVSVMKNEWKDQDLGLNQVAFDESTMPAPACSCTGKLRQCYKWGNGGWQSSCCTMSISMYPLPVMPNKRHARMGGRKMSGGAFTKLLSRLAAEGHDLSTPVDLKDHWAKHGTNRYITIR